VLLHALLALSFIGAWASSTYLILAKHVLGYADQSLAVPFGRISNAVHITAGLLFCGALLALAGIWRRSMEFAPYDRDWLKGLGGYFSRRYRILPAGRFNAGQKIWFRVSVMLGLLVSVSGALIYYPDLLGRRWDITLYIVHTAFAVALSAMVIVHVYLAVVAHPRSVRAMVTGHIDEACVREDHPLEPLPDTSGPAS
jgi:formate dehydrogenase subunit gamma